MRWSIRGGGPMSSAYIRHLLAANLVSPLAMDFIAQYLHLWAFAIYCSTKLSACPSH